ncbi:hypothetical protein MTO96_038914 [Rhipicephalus appendiculatus]
MDYCSSYSVVWNALTPWTQGTSSLEASASLFGTQRADKLSGPAVSHHNNPVICLLIMPLTTFLLKKRNSRKPLHTSHVCVISVHLRRTYDSCVASDDGWDFYRYSAAESSVAPAHCLATRIISRIASLEIIFFSVDHDEHAVASDGVKGTRGSIL